MFTLRYCKEEQHPYNFGDCINPVIFRFFTESQIEEECCIDTEKKEYTKSILGIGSIIQHANPNDVVYGTGIMNLDMEMHGIPKKINSVRGPITREFLQKNNIECPEIYGDPVLLMPFIYDPVIEKENKIGIVLHYLHELDTKELDGCLYIDIENPNWRETIDNIKKCKIIFSTSLHGIILGDAYEIPSYYMEIGDGYNQTKYRDYYLSVGREFYPVKFNATLEVMLHNIKKYKCKIDIKKMIEVFPYINEKIKNNCISLLNKGFLSYLK
jgi:pyruvyltransferase